MAVKAWTAETVSGGDTKWQQKVTSGITVKSLLNHCPNYVRNHGEIITKSLSKLCQESLENHVLNWDDCF